VETLNKYIGEYRKQVEKGDIVKAYRGLMSYILDLRSYLSNKYPDFAVSGSVYYGYMDMSYFSFTPAFLQDRKLKIALVFIHDKVSWEIWLAGANRQVQSRYSKLFTEKGWDKYHITAIEKGVDSIIDCVLTDKPDFDDLSALTTEIESKALKFIDEIQKFLVENEI